jgi:hypothetical protein
MNIIFDRDELYKELTTPTLTLDQQRSLEYVRYMRERKESWRGGEESEPIRIPFNLWGSRVALPSPFKDAVLGLNSDGKKYSLTVLFMLGQVINFIPVNNALHRRYGSAWRGFDDGSNSGYLVIDGKEPLIALSYDLDSSDPDVRIAMGEQGTPRREVLSKDVFDNELEHFEDFIRTYVSSATALGQGKALDIDIRLML